MNVRVRIKVERFSIEPDERGYDREVKRETMLETCVDPTVSNLAMMGEQVSLCLHGYEPEVIQMAVKETT